MKREAAADIPLQKRFHARLLLLIPNSDEGYFRHSVESENQKNPGGLIYDIPYALDTVRGAQREIFGNLDVTFLQIRLYEHCPFAFAFATESEIYVEQYDYRDQREDAAMPLINYEGGTSQYKEQIVSLDIIWGHARPADVLDEVGTAAAIREAGIKNIFRHAHRAVLTMKQVGAVRSAGASRSTFSPFPASFMPQTRSLPANYRRSRVPARIASE